MKLIDKDALMAWLKERIREYWNDSKNTMGIYPFALEEVIKYVDTLEIKDVNLEKECDNWRHNHFHGRRDKEASGEYLERSSQVDLAKHFFELGMQRANNDNNNEEKS